MGKRVVYTFDHCDDVGAGQAVAPAYCRQMRSRWFSVIALQCRRATARGPPPNQQAASSKHGILVGHAILDLLRHDGPREEDN